MIIYFSKRNNNKVCETGEGEKCLTCDEDNNCSSCNFGYKLINGECIVHFSFKLIYNITENNTNIDLINKDYLNIIKEMSIDDINVNPTTNYTFPFSDDNYTVYILLDISKIVSLYKLFYNINRLKSIDFSESFNTRNIRDMDYLFSGCSSLSAINFSNAFNTENVVSMSYMFQNCSSLTFLDITNFNTRNLKNVTGMFQNCESLTSLDISHFNTKNVKDMGYFFANCYSLTSIDLLNLNTENVI